MSTTTGKLGDATAQTVAVATDKITITDNAGTLKTTLVSVLTTYLKTLFIWKQSDFLILKSTEVSGIKVDEVSPVYTWADLKGQHYIDASGTSAPTMETFETGVQRPAYNATDVCRTELHLEHNEVIGGIKYFHPHIQIATGATAATTNLVLTHVVKHSYGSIGTGETRGANPAPITIVQTITVAEINAIGSGKNKPFDIEYANTGGTGGKLNSSNMFIDDIIFITTTVTSIPSITGGTSTKVAMTPIDGHREVRDGTGTKFKDRVTGSGSFYGTT